MSRISGENQGIDYFLNELTSSLVSGIICSVNQALYENKSLPKTINFYGAEEDILLLISNRVKNSLGAESSLYSKAVHRLNADLSEKETYHINVGWFIRMYDKNGRVSF